MSDSFLQKTSVILGLVIIGLMFALLVMMANMEIKDLDLWLHLAMGKFIAANGFVPTEDILSCRLSGQPWNNHEWLFQIILFSAYQAGGADGLILLQVIVVALTFALLFFLGYSRSRQLLVVLLLFLVLFVYRQRFTIRPDIFSLLFMVAYFRILFTYIDRKGAPFLLFLIQVLWVNIHGFFIFGPLIVLVSFFSEWAKRHIRLPFEWNRSESLDNQDYRQLKIILGCVIAACFVNPQGVAGALYPFQVLLQSASGEASVFFGNIVELQKPLTGLGDLFVFNQDWHYKILILVSTLSFILNWRKIELSTILYWLIFLAFSLTAVRNLVYFAFVAYLVTLVNLAALSLKDFTFVESLQPKAKSIAAIGLKLFLIFHFVGILDRISYNGYFDYDTYERKSEFGGISKRNFPYNAVNFLVENKVKGNFFNDFNSGAYIIGRCYPNIKVFMDGRTELYGPELFREYKMAWIGNWNALDEAVNKYQLTGAFIDAIRAPAPPAILNYFYSKADWKLVYFGWDGSVFLKEVEQNRDIIAKYEINLSKWTVVPNDLTKLGLKHFKPYPNVSRAYALNSMGFYKQGIAEAQEALRILPNYALAHKALGHAYLNLKEYEESFYAFRAAKLVNPGDVESRYHLALLFELRNDLSRALEQCQVVLNRKPGDKRTLLLMARILVRLERFTQAMDIVRALPKSELYYTDDLEKMAKLLEKFGQNAFAKEMLDLTLSIDPSNKELRKSRDRLK